MLSKAQRRILTDMATQRSGRLDAFVSGGFFPSGQEWLTIRKLEQEGLCEKQVLGGQAYSRYVITEKGKEAIA